MAQTIFEQLAPYAGMTVVPGVTVGRLNYANQQITFSDATFALSTKLVQANTEVQFVTSAITETGQGFSSGLTLGQTNSKFSKGQPPANQCLVARQLGFGVYYLLDDQDAPTNDPADILKFTLPSARDLFAILSNFSWDLTIGRGIARTIGGLMEYPDAGGAWSTTLTSVTAGEVVAPTVGAQNGVPACHFVTLPIPIIFPPLVNVAITAKCGSSFNLLDAPNNSQVVFRLSLGGFLMTMPV